MAWTDDGGPAFPVEFPDMAANGMSLRDWFAGHIAAALVTQLGRPEFAANLARQSYESADAMLAERKRTGGD